MSNGDLNDMHSRLKALLPAGWFCDETPVLDGVLTLFAQYLSWCYSLYNYARQQTRITTASDGWLDIAAQDFFGAHLRRDEGMTDIKFRNLIKKSMFRERGTRQAILNIINDLTGYQPEIIEPQCAVDTGGYCMPTSGYGVAGRYGSLQIPCQAFVIVHRPDKEKCNSDMDSDIVFAGHESLLKDRHRNSVLTHPVTDAQIFAAITATKMEGTIVWVRVQ
ncbi:MULTISPECIES: hypothetical protein [unclassified Pantoea]|uniref:hypothetical protein n=1 Tax=unclassified Pantoea TaxID=2630326 RepID=UPI001CD31EF5|nr:MULTISPECIES: hypothetical protein [unclassified Pantoea]MCA1179774.1 hypothetical protein [Pantoea sp. alder69]MCA1253624.1 hypothetical protein [Pantoea sp. alder70]MCA1268260.1 hypothetical protein [Pantoea sp. alder81]